MTRCLGQLVHKLREFYLVTFHKIRNPQILGLLLILCSLGNLERRLMLEMVLDEKCYTINERGFLITLHKINKKEKS